MAYAELEVIPRISGGSYIVTIPKAFFRKGMLDPTRPVRMIVQQVETSPQA